MKDIRREIALAIMNNTINHMSANGDIYIGPYKKETWDNDIFGRHRAVYALERIIEAGDFDNQYAKKFFDTIQESGRDWTKLYIYEREYLKDGSDYYDLRSTDDREFLEVIIEGELM